MNDVLNKLRFNWNDDRDVLNETLNTFIKICENVKGIFVLKHNIIIFLTIRLNMIGNLIKNFLKKKKHLYLI